MKKRRLSIITVVHVILLKDLGKLTLTAESLVYRGSERGEKVCIPSSSELQSQWGGARV